MKVNPGLKSRFSQRLHFPDFSASEAAELFDLTLQRSHGLSLSPRARSKLPALMQQASVPYAAFRLRSPFVDTKHAGVAGL